MLNINKLMNTEEVFDVPDIGDIGMKNATIAKLRQECRDLFLSEKYVSFQLTECQRQKDALISEVDLMERLLKERHVKNEDEQTRLIERYESQFEKLRAECELQRNRMEPLERQINALTLREGQLIKELSDKEIATNQQKIVLNSTRKEMEKIKIKLDGTEQELKEQSRKYFNQEQEIFDLSSKAKSASQYQEKEKEQALSMIKSKFELELQEMKLSLVNKEVFIKEKEGELIKLQAAVQEQNRKVIQMTKAASQNEKLDLEYQKMKLKYREAKLSEKETSQKLTDANNNNTKLSKKYEQLKKKNLSSSSEDKETLRLTRRENLDLKSKLAIQEKTLRHEIQTLQEGKNKLEKKLVKLERKLKDSREKLFSSDEEDNKKYRLLERENKKLKDDQSYSRNEIEDLRKEKKRLKEEMKTKESESQEEIKSMQNKIRDLVQELEFQKAKNQNDSTNTTMKVEEKETVAEENCYEDDFEEESVASNDESEVSKKEEAVEETFPHKEKIITSINTVNRKDDEYDDDSFQDVSLTEESVKSDTRSFGCLTADADEGELCEESVAEIESDIESRKSDLFFGDKLGNVSLGVPQISSVVETPIAEDETIVTFHVPKPKSRSDSPLLMLTKAPSMLLSQENSTTSLSDAPLLNADKPQKNLKVGKTPKSSKPKKTSSSGQIAAAEIFGSQKPKKSAGGKKKNSSDGDKISASDIFGSATSLKSKKNKKTKIVSKESSSLSATDLFGVSPSAKVNKKQSKGMNRDINSILGNL